MSSQASNGCEHFGHLRDHCNRHIIDRGWLLTLGPVGGFIFLLLVQVKPAFIQRIHILILRIRVPSLVNVVQLIDRKVMFTIGNTSLILFTIYHANTAATAAATTTFTPHTITTSGLGYTGRICCQNITAAEFTVFR